MESSDLSKFGRFSVHGPVNLFTSGQAFTFKLPFMEARRCLLLKSQSKHSTVLYNRVFNFFQLRVRGRHCR